MTRFVVIGGGPAGYEAALVAAQLGADVTLVEPAGLGGACVVTDCVPSKALVAVSDVTSTLGRLSSLGVRTEPQARLRVDAAAVNARVNALARAQSDDVAARLRAAGVRVLEGRGAFAGPREPDATYRVAVTGPDGAGTVVAADVVLVATGATPRELPSARPDGRRILTWRQLYDLEELPERLVVVGSGVTGAEFSSAYLGLGVPTVLVSSRSQVLPGEDADAAAVLDSVLQARGMEIIHDARAVGARRDGSGRDAGVRVELADGRTVAGSHVLVTIGSVPNSSGLGLHHVGVAVGPGGHVQVDRVSRTSAPNVYAAGDLTGVMMLASVAAMQGRIAVWHALGEAVTPLRLAEVSSTVFTSPEIATVGVTQRQVDAGEVVARSVMLPLATNARAKMMDLHDGFVKLFCRRTSGIVVGGVVVAPHASELVLPIAMAVSAGMTVDQVAHTFAIYPSLSGSLTEAARLLMQRGE